MGIMAAIDLRVTFTEYFNAFMQIMWSVRDFLSYPIMTDFHPNITYFNRR